MTNVWTMDDALRGICQLEDVGEERPMEVPPEPPKEEGPPSPLTRAERALKVQRIIDGVLHAIEANPSAALDDNGSTVNKLIDLASKLDDTEAKQSDKPIQQLSSEELTKRLFYSLGLDKEPPESAALQAWRRMSPPA